ncbi:MAG: hypothetical protein WCP09_00910 [Candidatus Taylorbacteria bacterium]
MRKFKDYIGVTILGIVVMSGAALVQSSTTWSPPQTAPPDCVSGFPGCDAPLNVGDKSQSKLGQLMVNTSITNPFAVGLRVFGQALVDSLEVRGTATTTTLNATSVNTTNIKVTGGSPVAGKVLTASDAAGNMTWQTPATGSGGVAKIIAGTNVTISPTTGVGNVTVTATVPTAVSGSVGGGCSSSQDGTGTAYRSYWGVGSLAAPAAGGCTCTSGYTSRLIFSEAISGMRSYLCVHN